jgi:hypothetical protein
VDDVTHAIEAPKERLLAAARRMPSPTRRAARARSWLVLPWGGLLAGACYFVLDGVEHGRGRPSWFCLASTLGWGTVAVLSMWGALGRAASASWRSRSALVAIAVGTPAVLLALSLMLAALRPERSGADLHATGLKCLGLTLAVALFPLVALTSARRESDPVHPAPAGAALGSASGASAGILVELWCPTATPWHLAVGHVLPIVVLMALGALLGARSLAMRQTS